MPVKPQCNQFLSAHMLEKERQVDFLKYYRDEDATGGRTGLSFSQV